MFVNIFVFEYVCFYDVSSRLKRWTDKAGTSYRASCGSRPDHRLHFEVFREGEVCKVELAALIYVEKPVIRELSFQAILN